MITDELWNVTDTIGKAILARRADRLFARAFGREEFEISRKDFSYRGQSRNHVQVHLRSAKDRVLLVFTSLLEESGGIQFLTGRVQIRIGCVECSKDLSRGTDVWLPRTRNLFRERINQSIRSSRRNHICLGPYTDL